MVGSQLHKCPIVLCLVVATSRPSDQLAARGYVDPRLCGHGPQALSSQVLRVPLSGRGPSSFRQKGLDSAQR